MKKLKRIPKFKSEGEEREFWAKNDATDFFDASKRQEFSFPKLRPSTKTISLRLPEDLLAELKVQANKRDVPYQSLIKIYLNEKIREESA